MRTVKVLFHYPEGRDEYPPDWLNPTCGEFRVEDGKVTPQQIRAITATGLVGQTQSSLHCQNFVSVWLWAMEDWTTEVINRIKEILITP